MHTNDTNTIRIRMLLVSFVLIRILVSCQRNSMELSVQKREKFAR